MSNPVINYEFIESCALSYKDTNEVSDYLALNNIVRAWNQNINQRFGRLRELVSINQSLRDELMADKKIKDQFLEITKGISCGIEKHLKHPEYPFHVRILLKEDTAQAMASHYNVEPAKSLFQKSSISVGFLVSAPWNIKMASPLEEHETAMKVQGSGATLLLTMIKKAYFDKCSFLYLKPLDDSFHFYKHMNMSYDSNQDVFYLDLRLKVPECFAKYVPNFQKKAAKAITES